MRTTERFLHRAALTLLTAALLLLAAVHFQMRREAVVLVSEREAMRLHIRLLEQMNEERSAECQDLRQTLEGGRRESAFRHRLLIVNGTR
jgi:hypothetical protein